MIWFKLHQAPDAKKWLNILIKSELIFSLPFSNGKVERIFSAMKIIKADRKEIYIWTLSDLEIQLLYVTSLLLKQYVGKIATQVVE